MGFGNASIIAVPLGFLIGAGYGTACAVASSDYPAADADFRRILGDADAGSLKRALEARLRAPRPECAASTPGAAADAVVEIERVESGMACIGARQEFWVAAKWRVVSRSGKMLSTGTTRQESKSSLSVADWFAQPAEARSEIEEALGKIGETIALQFFADGASSR